MKVIFVSSGNSNMGISSIILNQGQSLNKKGVDIEYFPIKGKGIKSYVLHIFKLRKHLMTKKYDVIHAHYGFCGIICYCAKKNERLVVSFMGDDLIGSIGNSGRYTIISKLFTLVNKLFSKYLYDFSIVKSDQMRKLLNNHNVALIPNGVNINLFAPGNKENAMKKVGFCAEKYYIIFISKPTRKEKNFDLAKRVINTITDINIELIAVYDEPNENIVNYYNAADLLLLTSIHEGSPNVIKEAMSCNCPIVATNVGDIEMIIGDTHGALISSYDIEEIAEKIKVILNNIRRTNGRDRIIGLKLDDDSIANRIINIYTNIVKS